MIARTLGTDEDTVRRRVKRMEQIGFITRWGVLLNPKALGLSESVVVFDVPPSVNKNKVKSQLRFIPGVWMIADFYGSFIGFILRHDTIESSERIVNLVQTLTSATSIRLSTVPYPECATNLAKIDWEIISNLSQNPRKSYREISQELNISSRTVQRRLEKIAGSGVMFSLAAIKPQALEGTILGNLAVGFERQNALEVNRRIAEGLDEHLWHVFATIPRKEELQYTWFNLALPNVSKARELSEWTKEQPGVRACRMEFYEDHDFIFEAFDEHLKRKLAQF